MNKSISKNIIFKLILNIFNIVVPILIGPYAVRTLGPEKIGKINYAQSIFAYFFIFASFGVYQYGLREISKVRKNQIRLSKVFTSLFTLTILTNIIVSIIFIIFVNKSYSNNTELYNIFIILSFNFLSNIFYIEWVNEAIENYDFITIKTIVIRVIYIILLISFVKNSSHYKIYIFLLVLSNILNNIVSFIYVKRKIKLNFKNIQLLRHIKPMILVVLLSNSNLLYTQLDRIMIGNVVNTIQVGYYTIAQNISNIINSMLITLLQVTIPRMSNYVASDNNDEYENLINKISKIYLLLLFPISIGMFILSKEIILLYGGSQYLGAIGNMKIFSIYIITLGYESILSNNVMYIKGKEKIQVKIIFLCGIINFLLNMLLVKLNLFSSEAAIITTLIANIGIIILEYIYIKYIIKLNFNIFNWDKTKYMIFSLIFIPITYFISKIINNMYIYIVLVIVVNACIYFLILILIKDELIKEILIKLKVLKK